MIPAIILFAATYVLMLTFSKYRPYFALAAAAIFIVSGMLGIFIVTGIIIGVVTLVNKLTSGK